jgi:hypothetical protein
MAHASPHSQNRPIAAVGINQAVRLDSICTTPSGDTPSEPLQQLQQLQPIPGRGQLLEAAAVATGIRVLVSGAFSLTLVQETQSLQTFLRVFTREAVLRLFGL